jgi:hypothetical protein
MLKFFKTVVETIQEMRMAQAKAYIRSLGITHKLSSKGDKDV